MHPQKLAEHRLASPKDLSNMDVTFPTPVNRTASNSLLQQSWLPDFAAFQAAEIPTAISLLIARAQHCLDLVANDATLATYEAVFVPLEQVDDDLAKAFSTFQHLHRVADSDALRAVYGDALDQITAYQSALLQHQSLYQKILGMDAQHWPTAQRRLQEKWLREFRLGGVGLVGAEAERFREIAAQLAKLATEFEQALMDATDAWSFNADGADQLRGLPADSLARAQQRGAEHGVAFQLGLDYPSYSAVMTFAEDRALRELYYYAYATRASDQGPHAGRFDNSKRIERMLALKLEAAQLLGFEHIAAQSLSTKMAQTPEQIFALLYALRDQARPAAQREIDELKAYAAKELGISELTVWDVAFAAEKFKAQHLGFDDEQLRPYFPLPRVLDGLFKTISDLFGVQIVQRATSVWHEDVQFFVIERHGQAIAGFYLDLYARQKKRGGAWMDVCRTRRRIDQQTRLPVAYLTCNFAPATTQIDGSVQPALLRHNDVVTLFHEFGHGLHLMLTEIELPGIGGIEGVEWDAVELPSQFMENFCWTQAGLELLSGHWQSGAKLPTALQDKLLASKNFHAGLFLVRQLEFALFDLHLHLQNPTPDIQAVLRLWAEIGSETSVLRQPTWRRFPHSFSHIFGGGYSAGYYSYLWAEVLSADAFSAFTSDANHAQLGEKFRVEVLAVGSSRPALDSFVAFRGRLPKVDALMHSYGLISTD
jgi:oligopeptidase A